MRLEFTMLGKPQPQGSSKGYVVKGRAVITSANPKLKAYRKALALEAKVAAKRARVHFAQHQPVRVTLVFTFLLPPSASKKRTEHVVKPDLDKLARGAFDSLTGTVWHDDGQAVELFARKQYGPAESVSVVVEDV